MSAKQKLTETVTLTEPVPVTPVTDTAIAQTAANEGMIAAVKRIGVNVLAACTRDEKAARSAGSARQLMASAMFEYHGALVDAGKPVPTLAELAKPGTSRDSFKSDAILAFLGKRPKTGELANVSDAQYRERMVYDTRAQLVRRGTDDMCDLADLGYAAHNFDSKKGFFAIPYAAFLPRDYTACQFAKQDEAMLLDASYFRVYNAAKEPRMFRTSLDHLRMAAHTRRDLTVSVEAATKAKGKRGATTPTADKSATNEPAPASPVTPPAAPASEPMLAPHNPATVAATIAATKQLPVCDVLRAARDVLRDFNADTATGDVTISAEWLNMCASLQEQIDTLRNRAKNAAKAA